MTASVVGFLGNEAVAAFRIRVGREISSAALVADGYHARTDGWTVDPGLYVAEGHAIAREVNHRLVHHLGYLDGTVVHLDPVEQAGEEHHRIAAHAHDGLPTHSH